MDLRGQQRVQPSLSSLNDAEEPTLSKTADDTKLGGVPDIPKGHAAIQTELNTLQKWADRIHMKVSKGKLHLGRNNSQYRLGSHPAGKQLGREGPGGSGDH